MGNPPTSVATAKAELTETKDPAHFDETGGRIECKLWLMYVVCTAFLTYYVAHPKRGCRTLEAIGIFPRFKGTAFHDAYRSFSSSSHQFISPSSYSLSTMIYKEHLW